ncbi:hypothetical protein [Ramlibacter sp.]|uniref:hypothetical protein n=1 Tax=Ramlibacter sp. TaxID=1917967 RepID=UPI003D0EE076
MRHIALAATAVLLTACASGPYYSPGGVPPVMPNPGAQVVHPLARSATYACEDLTTIVLTEGQRDARAMLNSGLELGLAQQPGGRFGAPPYEFRAAGSEGTWINQGKVMRCRVR